MTGLEALDKLISSLYDLKIDDEGYPVWYLTGKRKEYCDIVVKELKALELIKENNIVVAFLRACPSVEFYNNAKVVKLSKENFELLKEVLEDE